MPFPDKTTRHDYWDGILLSRNPHVQKNTEYICLRSKGNEITELRVHNLNKCYRIVREEDSYSFLESENLKQQREDRCRKLS